MGYDVKDTASILIPFSGKVKMEVEVDNRAFAHAYAFSTQHTLLEVGFKIDGLKYEAQWWGSGARRRSALTTPSKWALDATSGIIILSEINYNNACVLEFVYNTKNL